MTVEESVVRNAAMIFLEAAFAEIGGALTLEQKQSALDWFRRGKHKPWCDIIDWDPDRVRDKFMEMYHSGERLNITRPSSTGELVLNHLGPGGCERPGEIARALGRNQQTIAATISRLRRDGLVERLHDSRVRRIK